MVLIIALLLLILCFIALLSVDAASGKRALSVCSGIVLAFLKSAQVLLFEYLDAIALFISILLACGNHFVIDYYIVFLFSYMILIAFHIIKISRYSSAAF